MATRRIGAQFYASGGNVLSVLGSVAGGLRNVGSAGQQAGRNLTYMERQLRAIRVTLQYAFAGTVVNNIRNAFQSIRDLQRGMANIGAIAEMPRSMGGGFLTDFPEQMAAMRTGIIETQAATATPAADIAETLRAIYSSLQDIRPEDARGLAELATQGAAISETDPRSFVQAVISMKNAFGKETDDLEEISNQFFRVIQRSINMSGDEWAKYSGRIVTSAQQAGLSLEEMNASMILATRYGGTAATNVRHLNQLWSRIRQPVGKEAEAAYAQAGLTPERMASMSGIEIVNRLWAEARSRGVQGRAGRMTDEALTDLEGMDSSSNQLGLTGQGALFLQRAITRMESLRMLSVLGPQFETGDLQEELKAVGNESITVRQRFQEALDERPLDAMTQAFNAFTTGLLTNLDPVFRAFARLTMFFTDFLNYGQILDSRFGRWAGRMARGVNNELNARLGLRQGEGEEDFPLAQWLGGAIGIAGVGAALMNRRGRGGMGSVFRGLRRGGPTALTGALNVEAGMAAVQNISNGSRSAPFWVVIHPLSWTMAGNRFGGAGGGDIYAAGRGGSRTGRLGRLGRFLARRGAVAASAATLAAGTTVGVGAATVGGAAALAAGIPLLLAGDSNQNNSRRSYDQRVAAALRGSAGQPMLNRIYRKWQSGAELTDVEKQALQMATGGKGMFPRFRGRAERYLEQQQVNRAKNMQNAQQAAAFFSSQFPMLNAGILSSGKGTPQGGNGKGEAVVTLVPGPKLENWLKEQRVVVPTTLWNQGGGATPTSRGKSKTNRGR